MNAPIAPQLDNTAFCRWVERQEGKFEWKEGRIVGMSNVTKARARIVADLVRALSARLDFDQWSLTALTTCLIVSQDEAIVRSWQRAVASEPWPARPQEISGRDQSIGIAALGVWVPLAEIFRGIGID